MRLFLPWILKLILWSGAGSRALVHWLALHTGVPALLVAAVLLVVGYRVLRRSARFLVEVALVAALLVAAAELGFLRW